LRPDWQEKKSVVLYLSKISFSQKPDLDKTEIRRRVLKSKRLEEVRKRRAKASPSRLNLYQKTLLVAGVLTLLFLAVGLSYQLATFLAAGVAGGALLIFLIFKYFKARKERKNRAALQETIPEGEEALEPEPISSRAEAEKIADSPGVISEQINSDALQYSISPEPEGAFPTQEIPPVGKEDLGPSQGFSGDGVLAQIHERPARLEEKVINLEDMLIPLEGKLGKMAEKQLDPEADLYTMLTNLDEKQEEIVSEASLERAEQK
jgi:hypothetical protein